MFRIWHKIIQFQMIKDKSIQLEKITINVNDEKKKKNHHNI